MWRRTIFILLASVAFTDFTFGCCPDCAEIIDASDEANITNTSDEDNPAVDTTHGDSQVVLLQTSAQINSNEMDKNAVRETHCTCGIRNSDRKTKVRSEIYSQNHAWPWMAVIVNISDSDSPVAYCGGTLINDRYILTAAHCIPDMRDTGFSNFRIYLGTNFIENGTNFVDTGIQRIITHSKFDLDTADYDITLIRLTRRVTFTRWISPICLRQAGSPFVGTVGLIAGWGSFNLSEPTENRLKESDVEVVDNGICSRNYSTVDIPVTSNMLCAALPGQDPCKGDSGGPLMIEDKDNKNQFTQIGIISHGQGCAVQSFPAIFTRVQQFTTWIMKNTHDATYCSGTF